MSCGDLRLAIIPSDFSLIWHLFFWHLKDQVTIMSRAMPVIPSYAHKIMQVSRYLDPFRLAYKEESASRPTHNLINFHPRVVKLKGLTFMSRSPKSCWNCEELAATQCCYVQRWQSEISTPINDYSRSHTRLWEQDLMVARAPRD